jgi:hypothetical protein
MSNIAGMAYSSLEPGVFCGVCVTYLFRCLCCVDFCLFAMYFFVIDPNCLQVCIAMGRGDYWSIICALKPAISLFQGGG